MCVCVFGLFVCDVLSTNSLIYLPLLILLQFLLALALVLVPIISPCLLALATKGGTDPGEVPRSALIGCKHDNIGNLHVPRPCSGIDDIVRDVFRTKSGNVGVYCFGLGAVSTHAHD